MAIRRKDRQGRVTSGRTIARQWETIGDQGNGMESGEGGVLVLCCCCGESVAPPEKLSLHGRLYVNRFLGRSFW